MAYATTDLCPVKTETATVIGSHGIDELIDDEQNTMPSASACSNASLPCAPR